MQCRTPADHFFPDATYSALIDALQEYGEQQLGCRGISPVWLSYYVDGCRQVLLLINRTGIGRLLTSYSHTHQPRPITKRCMPRQELHTDSPHGPLAFVLSLTQWEGRSFNGGETVLFQPHMLDFWAGHDPERGIEFKDMVGCRPCGVLIATTRCQYGHAVSCRLVLDDAWAVSSTWHGTTLRAGRLQVTLVEPRFNRLTVFDGRYPHGVRMVEGTRNPVKARVVLHGWFTEPAPFFDGKLPACTCFACFGSGQGCSRAEHPLRSNAGGACNQSAAMCVG